MKVGEFEGIDICIEVEEERKCGFRKPASNGVGIYLMGGLVMEQCERLPFPLRTCPVCGEGVKFSRGFTWITPCELFDMDYEPICSTHDPEMGTFNALWEEGGHFAQEDGQHRVNIASENHNHEGCHMCNPPEGSHGLLWVGRQSYTTAEFLAEAVFRGISRKIRTLPHDFVLGETVVYLAHVDGVKEGEAGVFSVFKPTGIDLVVDDAEDIPDVAKNIAKRAKAHSAEGTIRIVEVEHD